MGLVWVAEILAEMKDNNRNYYNTSNCNPPSKSTQGWKRDLAESTTAVVYLSISYRGRMGGTVTAL